MSRRLPRRTIVPSPIIYGAPMSRVQALNHRELYRLPWSLTDNVIEWLEPTKQCNLYCEGCYSTNAPGSHKSLEIVAQDLDTFDRFRQTDAVSIAGGDPLVHPEIVAIVREVARRGLKPIVNTNGLALTAPLLRALKEAGLKGFTFHVDSGQKRPGWTGKNEIELNALRQQFAEMVAEVGGLSCAFNSTVYEHTLAQVPDIVAWGRAHAKIVHVMVFIAFRAAITDGRFDYYVNDEKIEVKPLAYGKAKPQRSDISSPEVLAEIQKRFPEVTPCAYLNGTEKPDSMKWLMSLPITDGKRYLGSVGPKFIELAGVQSLRAQPLPRLCAAEVLMPSCCRAWTAACAACWPPTSSASSPTRCGSSGPSISSRS
jgi:molybdenum cofactor biosynthesis enzyme MoaA